MKVWWFFLKKLHFFSSLLEYEHKAIKLLVEKTRQACLKWNLEVGVNILREDNFVWKKIYFFLFIGFALLAKFFPNFGDNIPAHVLTAFYFSMEEFEQNYKLGESNFTFHFHKVSKKIRPWVKKTALWSKLHSRCPEERFEEKKFFEKTLFYIDFGTWPKKLVSWTEKHQGVGWISICVSRGTFLGKTSFWTD